jgi:plastocyanin
MKKITIPFFVMFAVFCALGASSFAVTHDVTVADNSFSPQNVPITVGDTVTWTLSGLAAFSHTTTSGSGCIHNTTGEVWDSGTLGSQPFSRVFNTPGTYEYYCTFHCGIGMTGTVTVNPAIIPAPIGQTTIFFSAIATPVLGSSNITSMPIGIGALATGGSTLTIAVDLGPYAVPVDVYAAFIVSTNPLNLVNLSPTLAFQNVSLNDVVQTLSTGVVPPGVEPWMTNVSTEVNATLFSNVPISNVPPGQYTANLLVTPHGGNFADFDLYRTIFTIP